MTPARYRECLALLDLSQNEIARLLGCSDRLTHRWAGACCAREGNSEHATDHY
jgi:hypothetical protein